MSFNPCRKYSSKWKIKDLHTLIRIFTLVLMIFGISIDQEWYLEVGLLKYVPDTALMKTIDKIVQNVQFVSIVCVFIAVTLEKRCSFLTNDNVMNKFNHIQGYLNHSIINDR